jgi:hypothetical protein
LSEVHLCRSNVKLNPTVSLTRQGHGCNNAKQTTGYHRAVLRSIAIKDRFAVFRCLVNGQNVFTLLGTLKICAEKTIVSFMYKGKQDVVISFMIARYFEQIPLESEPFCYLEYCMIECAQNKQCILVVRNR